MTQFLAWLWTFAYQVYQWFGVHFNDYLNRILSIGSQVGVIVTDTVNATVQWLLAKVNGIISDLNGLFDWVSYQVSQIRDDFSRDLNGLFDWVTYQIEQVKHIQLPDVSGLLSELWTYVENIPASIQQWVLDRIADVRNAILDSFGWVQSAYEYITGLIDNIPFDLFPQIVDFFRNGYVNIKAFLDNPVVFIFDLLRETFVSFLCFVLAYALGTTISDIDLTPPWRK